MSDMFLLGAGASAEADRPTSVALTDAVIASFEAQERSTARSAFAEELLGPTNEWRQLRVLRYAIGGIQFHRGMSRSGSIAPTAPIDVEELVATVKLLAHRREERLAPFVGAWHHVVEELDQYRPQAAVPWTHGERTSRIVAQAVGAELGTPLRGDEFTIAEAKAIEHAIRAACTSTGGGVADHGLRVIDSVVRVLVARLAANVSDLQRPALRMATPEDPDPNRGDPVRVTGDALQKEIVRLAGAATPRAANGGVYRDVLDKITRVLVEKVWVRRTEVEKVQYLRPLLDGAVNGGAVTVVTLNYDNCVERLAETSGVPCDTGLAGWPDGRGFQISGAGVRLLKLHGSIDWAYEGGYDLDARVVQVDHDSPGESHGRDLAIVFGADNKLRDEGPFLDLLYAFVQLLERTDTLVVVGYSMRDTHVNAQLRRWFNRVSSRRVIVIDPGFGANPNPFAAYLRDQAAIAPARVHWIRDSEGKGVGASEGLRRWREQV